MHTPKYNTSNLGKKTYSVLDIATALFELTNLALERKSVPLQTALATRLAKFQPVAIRLYEQNRQVDIGKKFSGYPRDLDTVHPAEAVLEMAYALKLLGKYDGAVRQQTESFIDTYVENHGFYTGKYLTTGYNKEVYAMHIASLVALLYAEESRHYPITRSTFEVFWNGIVHRSYETDNSPHYDAGTGFWLILRMALLHHREDDLRQGTRFHDILTRMALTVANNGQTAKWGKSMEQFSGNELMPDGGAALSWCLKVGYRLFKDRFLLYTARKYEDLRLFGSNKTWRNDAVAIWPDGINSQQVSGVVCPPSVPLSTVTTRITSRKAYQGLLLGRGDTDVVTVQDKLILSTGRHPLCCT